MAANPGQDVIGAGSSLPVLNIAETRVGICILAQGQQHVCQQLATQPGGSHQSGRQLLPSSSLPISFSPPHSFSLRLYEELSILQTSVTANPENSSLTYRENVSTQVVPVCVCSVLPSGVLEGYKSNMLLVLTFFDVGIGWGQILRCGCRLHTSHTLPIHLTFCWGQWWCVSQCVGCHSVCLCINVLYMYVYTYAMWLCAYACIFVWCADPPKGLGTRTCVVYVKCAFIRINSLQICWHLSICINLECMMWILNAILLFNSYITLWISLHQLITW